MNNWRKLMNEMRWKHNGVRTDNWLIIDDNIVEKQVPIIQQWVINHLHYIRDIDYRIALKEFFWGDRSKMSPTEYRYKDFALNQLLGMYEMECKHEQ